MAVCSYWIMIIKKGERKTKFTFYRIEWLKWSAFLTESIHGGWNGNEMIKSEYKSAKAWRDKSKTKERNNVENRRILREERGVRRRKKKWLEETCRRWLKCCE